MTAITCTGCQHAYSESALFCPNCGRPKARQQVDALVGKVLGERFAVQEMIGQGGSGTIYRAEHVNLRRKVAIKILHDELSRDDLAVERFRREATTVAEIDNEHIVEIHDFGRTPDGRLYLAMELLEGETLDTILAREHQLSVERTADILIQTGEALMEAHAIGYVHRDLRPRNLYLANRRGKANFVKLLDFGLAKLVETDAHAASTSLGMTFGDPRYMSPEQARGDRIDRRADIYQLGCIAYEMLTGAPPFTGNRVFDILTKQVSEIPVPLPSRRPGVPLWMEAAVAKMLAKDPDNRFATTTRMVEALRRGLETGEVMDDDIARRRESIPPPSVSRVMQKMGLTTDPLDPTKTTKGLPPVPTPSKVPDSVELLRKRTGTPQLGVPVVAPPVGRATDGARTSEHATQTTGQIEARRRGDSIPLRDSGDNVRYHHDDPADDPADSVPRRARRDSESDDVRPSRRESEPRRRGDSEPVRRRGDSEPVRRSESRRGDSEPVRRRGDSEPVRRRDADSFSDLDQRVASRDDRPRRSTNAPAARVKRPTGEPSQSQAWFDEGEEEAAPRARRNTGSASRTDSLYDLPARKSRAPLIAILFGAAVVIGGVAFALTRNSSSSDDKPVQPPVAANFADAQASTILTETPDAAVEAPKVDATAVKSRPTTGGTGATGPVDHGSVDTGTFLPPGGGNVTGLGGTNPTPTPDAGTTVITVGPTNPNPTTPDAGINGGPQDPYGTGGNPGGGSNANPGLGSDNGSTPYDDPATPTTAAGWAAQGVKQLSGGDVANAAVSFKKALELDPNNAMATIGMGEIASRQGLWGDAIAHLTKAVKLSPKNAMAHTLLGEAYLRTNQMKLAAASFKTALEIDPNNARARDGYNEASAKAPPPTDE